MKKAIIFGIVVTCFMIYLFSCTNNPADLSGNGTRIGNPTIVGMIYQPDGKTPASKATVFLRKKDMLPDIGLKKQATDIAIVTTNADGTFEIDSINKGTYVIECSDRSDNYALYDSVKIDSSNSTVRLPADTLKPAGIIKGSITLSDSSDLGRVYVLVFGVQRFSVVDSNGNFTLDNLAEGNYDMRVITSLEHYKSFDTTKIAVLSGDTTKFNVKMFYNDIVPVSNLIVSKYDTLSHIVTLSWSKNQSSNIAGYNVYRKEQCKLSQELIAGLNKGVCEPATNALLTKINNSTIIDTVFRDEHPIPNETYVYTVTVVGNNSLESEKSEEVSATIATCFSADTVFKSDFGNFIEWKGCNPNKFIFQNGTYYVASNNEIRLYDTLFNQIGIWNNFTLRPFDIAGNNGSVYVATTKSSNSEVPSGLMSINIYNRNQLVQRLNLKDTLDSIPALGIDASLFTVSKNGNMIFISNSKDSIYICDSLGGIIRKIEGTQIVKTSGFDSKIYNGITTLATDQNNNIFIYENEKGITVYNADGIKIRFIDTKSHSLTNKITVAENGTIYFTEGSGFNVYSTQGEFITRYNALPWEKAHTIIVNDKIYMLSEENLFSDITKQAYLNSFVLKLTNNLPGR